MNLAHSSPEAQLEYLRTNVYRVPESDCLLWAGPMRKTMPMIKFGTSNVSARKMLARLTGRDPKNGMLCYATCGEWRCMCEGHIGLQSAKARNRRVADLGLTSAGVQRSLEVAKAIKHRAKLSMVRDRDTLRNLLVQGAPVREIAEHFGTTRANVYRTIDRWQARGVL